MKFKTGDKVKVISLDKTKEYLSVTKTMEKLLGNIATIKGFTSYLTNTYMYITGGWAFHEDDLQLITTDLEVE
jgi:hypothetical protein